ncbi:MAG TPA: 50S ribosomal protein L11 methyltransferase [Acidimicrobiales bacterium]
MELPPRVEALLQVVPVPMVPEIELAVAPDVTALWAAIAPPRGPEPSLPYWAVSWPAGRAIARFVLDRPEVVRGRRVLDLGCGSGLQAIAAAKAGAAEVVANDVDPLALAATRHNAARNGVSVTTLADDLLAQGGEHHPPGWDVVLAGDVCYQRDLAAAAEAWLRAAAGAGALVLLSDSGRPYAPTTGLDELAAYDVPVDEIAEGTARRTTWVWSLRPEP